MQRIFVVEDDEEIARNLVRLLCSEGFGVIHAPTQGQALAMLAQEQYDLALVDISLPDGNGFTVCTEIKQVRDVPVIFLTAFGDEASVVTGLNMGADDYVTKPFTTMELLARVNSHLRRYSRYLEMKEAGDGKEEDHNVFTVGGLEVHEETVEVFLDGSPIRLTPTEFKILLLLIKSPGRVFSAEEIYERVWNEQAINTDTIMVHIRKIREKIELNPRDPKYLKVVWGVGYKIEKQGRNGTGSKSGREKSEA